MEKELVKINYADIIFDEGVYPRSEGHDPALVQIYARDIEQIEEAQNFISINGQNKLVDGRHRHLAYKKNQDGNTDFKISTWKYAVTTDAASFRLANELQDKGKALTDDDKVSNAKKFHAFGYAQNEIAKILSVSAGTISKWLSRTVKEEKEKQRDKAFDLWMQCYSNRAIAETIGMSHSAINDMEESFRKKESSKHTFSDDFQPPIYNVWKTQNKTNKVSHFGNTEEQWLDNLIYLYTDPFDVVVDPFGGGGSTIDVCKHRGRRYFISDRKPIVEREHEIRKHDIATDGIPKPPMWKDVKLVYLDPPYWKQSEGKYSEDPTDLANMSLEDFNKILSNIIHQFSKKLSANSFIALIIQPTQWKAPDKRFTDHIGDMLRMIKLPVNMRYSTPYESQQCTAQMVEWAKTNKKTLVLTREIIVWEIV